MPSKKSKQKSLYEAHLKRARAMAGIDTCDNTIQPPAGAISADHSQLKHNNTYGPLPYFYADKLVTCRDCGKEEVWTAENQKWWYEVAKGNINSLAVRCRSCRENEKGRKEEA